MMIYSFSYLLPVIASVLLTMPATITSFFTASTTRHRSVAIFKLNAEPSFDEEVVLSESLTNRSAGVEVGGYTHGEFWKLFEEENKLFDPTMKVSRMVKSILNQGEAKALRAKARIVRDETKVVMDKTNILMDETKVVDDSICDIFQPGATEFTLLLEEAIDLWVTKTDPNIPSKAASLTRVKSMVTQVTSHFLGDIIESEENRNQETFSFPFQKWVDTSALEDLGLDAVAGMLMLVEAEFIDGSIISGWASGRSTVVGSGALLDGIHRPGLPSTGKHFSDEEMQSMRDVFLMSISEHRPFDTIAEGLEMVMEVIESKQVSVSIDKTQLKYMGHRSDYVRIDDPVLKAFDECFNKHRIQI